MNRFFLALMTVFVAAATGYAREFTDAQGRKLDAEIITLEGNQVTLKRAADGKQFTVPATMFSEADQAFIREYAANNISYSFELKNTRERVNKTSGRDGNVEIEKEEWSYKIDLRNISRADLENATVSYWVFKRADDGGKTKAAPRLAMADSIANVSIAKAAQYQFSTKPVTLIKTKLDGNYYYPDGAKNKSADAMGGFVVAITQGDKRVFEYATAPDLAAAATGTPKAEATTSAAGN